MERSTYLLSASEIQERIWGKTIRPGGMAKRLEQTRRGFLPKGVAIGENSADVDAFSQILGSFAPRVLAFSNPNNANTLLPEQIAVAGGWCAFRTKDVATLNSKSAIMNPATGTLEPVKSVEQVALWIPQAVAFDQIVESVGAIKASEYAVISERKLWTERITEKTGRILERRLTEAEKDQLETATETAERTRALITERYIRYITGDDSILFQRVVDENIWEGLQKARTEMLYKGYLSVSQLQRMFKKDAPGIPSTSLVWAMYAEPYFDMLRGEGYMSAKTAFIVEPALHACIETEPDNEIARTIFQSNGIYLDEKGFNNNTGFIAYLECVNGNGQNVRKELCIGDVPNIINWNLFFDSGGSFDPEKNMKLNPVENQLFIWGANILPYGTTLDALLCLSSLQDEFKAEKDKITSLFVMSNGRIDPNARESIQRKIDELRSSFGKQVFEENCKIAIELKKLFSFLTTDVARNI